MNTLHENKVRVAAPPARPVRERVLRALPWALAAAFIVNTLLARGLRLYEAGPVLTHAIEACLAAAVLMWVWRALARLENLPAGHVAKTGDTYDDEFTIDGSVFKADDGLEHDPAPAIDCHGNLIGDRDYIWSS